MLYLYLHPIPFDDLRSKCTIDLSKCSSADLADECENIIQHHKTCILFLGFLDVGWMLDPKHEARIRRVIRKFETHLVSIHLESIPRSWKNEIEIVYFKNEKDGCSQIINDGSALLD
jgi:hypothetical protein